MDVRPASSLGNLAGETTSFVGRQDDLAQVERLLGDARMVTLTGVGGVGKSRLSLRVAGRRRRAFRDGVWWVELAGVADPALVTLAVVQTLRIADQSGRPPLEVLADYLSGRQLLLVIDNCEHLLDACAILALTLLAAAPGLKILAASRERLGVPGEHVWPVAPLPVPEEADQSLPPPALGRFAALQLFADRAGDAQPGFAVTAENRQLVISICRRLEGIPLAVEMAARWLGSLPLPEIAARLEDRFALLDPDGRADLPRHQTLRAAIQWSYELCSLPEQMLWTRAAVFPAGLDLVGAEAACVGGALAEDVVLAAVEGLIDKSVLLYEESFGGGRYRMLETLREYGWERLREAGEESAMRRRHRDHYLELTERLNAEWFGPGQLALVARLRAEQDNLWAALEFCLAEPGETRVGLRMLSNLWFLWIACGMLREGRHWLGRALAVTRVEPARERGAALWVAGYITALQGDLDEAEAELVESRDAAKRFGDLETAACATFTQAIAAGLRNDIPEAMALYEDSLAQFAALGDGPRPAEVLARVNQAQATGFYVDPEQGIGLCQQICRVGEERGEVWVTSYAHHGIALASWRLGRLEEALAHARDCLRLKWEFGDPFGIVSSVEMLAWVSGASGQAERAAVLLGAARESWRLYGLPLFGSPHFITPHQACEARARAVLGDAGFKVAFRRGGGLNIEETITYALAEGADARSSGVPTTPATLTRREREVAALAAEGLSNVQIAAKLLIAPRTVESHVAHILTKLGFHSRVQIAGWAAAPPTQQP